MPRPPRRPVTVESAVTMTPGLRRLVVSGELAGWDPGGPGAHLKVFLPQEEGDPAMRTYTVRHFDAQAGALTLDFVLHGHGPASWWAADAAPGAQFAVSGQARSGYRPAEETRWCVLAGDHAALPAIAAIGEALPPELQTTVLVELRDQSDALALESAAELRTTWLAAGAEPCRVLVAAVTTLDLPPGPGEVWVGCEAGAMRQIRAHLLHERGLEHRGLHTRAYWKREVANHSDHDTGAEDDDVPQLLRTDRS